MAPTVDDSDRQIRNDPLAELRSDPPERGAEIAVAVSDGLATSTGAFGSRREKNAAREAARATPGVRRDADVERAVRLTLEWDPLVPDRKIRSTVTRGVVTLEGAVESWVQREDAENAIHGLAGVREVRNQIEVGPAITEEPRQTVR